MLAAHAGEVMDRISATRISAAAKVVKARCGADGTVHLLFDTADGPYYANSLWTFFSNKDLTLAVDGVC